MELGMCCFWLLTAAHEDLHMLKYNLGLECNIQIFSQKLSSNELWCIRYDMHVQYLHHSSFVLAEFKRNTLYLLYTIEGVFLSYAGFYG